jgi:hypothetical protein
MAALALAGCDGSAAEDAARVFLEQGAGLSPIKRTSTQSRFGHEYVKAWTEQDHEVLVEVAKEGSKWVAEHCVNPVTYAPQNCSRP